ncbi:MAG: ribonuclease III [Methylobacteriaceae bacterium]|nr:ribonuclease III [Methylobacteriaceae bacterium]
MVKSTKDLANLEKNLGYVFQDRALLRRALIHVSAPDSLTVGSYQRLEFLGDRVLGLVVAEMLYREFPDADEGELSKRLADLVRKDTCADIAELWGVGPYIKLGLGERQSGGSRNRTILADICESVLGAVYLDGGFDIVRRLVDRTFRARLAAPSRPLQDAKTALQEWTQGQGFPPPEYLLKSRSGPDHAPVFEICVRTGAAADGYGTGSSKREAEQNAAAAVLAREGIRPPPGAEPPADDAD